MPSQPESAPAPPTLLADDLPSFTDLFGAIEKAEGQGARSVLSPAAYLVDLLQLRDSVIPDDPAVDPDGYYARRPDVGEIPLDEKWTFGEVPHLQISNAIMKALAERDTPGDIRAQLESAIFPAPLPFSIDHARLALYLAKLGTDPSEIYRLYQRPIDGHEVARLRLGLSEQEHALFITPREADPALAELWGIAGDPEKAALAGGDLALVQRKLGLSLKELKALLYQDLSDGEIEKGSAAGFFINQDPGHPDTYITIDPSGTLRLSDGAPWSNRHLDRTMRFVRLARRLRLDFAELDWILQSAHADDLDADALRAIAVALEIRAKYGLAIDEVCCFWAEPKRHGHGDGPEPRDLFDRIFNRGHATPIEELVTQGASETLTNRLLATLRISRADLELLSGALDSRGMQAPPSRARIAVLYRMVALAKMLALRIGELVVLLDVLDAQRQAADHDELAVPIPVPGASSAGAPRPTFHALASPNATTAEILAALQKILRFKQWADQRVLSARQLAYICLERFDDGAPIDGVVSDGVIEAVLTELHQALLGMLLQPGDLETGSLTARGARAVFDALCEAGALAIAADAATPSPRALIRVQPPAPDLAAAMQRGVDERLEVYAGDLATAGIPAPEAPALFALLSARGYLEPIDGQYRIPAGAGAFFLDRANLPHFFVPEIAERQEPLFGVLAEKAAAFARAQGNLAAEAAEIAARLRSLFEQHERTLQRILSGQLGITDDLAGMLFQFVFGTPGESGTQTLASLTLPLFEIKRTAGADAEVLASASLASGFRRLRQFALILGKVGLGAVEARAYFENQHVHRGLPDALKLPPGFLEPPVRIDAITALPGGDLVVISGQKHALFSKDDYRLLGTGDLAQIPEVSLPASFLGGIDSAWKDADGTVYFVSGESYVSSAEPGVPKHVADRWGRVRNRIQQEQRVDAAVQDAQGRVFLFRGDQYVRYSDPQRLLAGDAFVDEGYPKSIRRGFAAEQVSVLPGVMHGKVDAVYRDTDGSYYFFAGDRFMHSTAPYDLREIRSRWGHVRNHLFDDNRVDAAFVHDDHTYLVRRDQIVRYTGGAYGFTDERYPVSFGKIPESDALLRVLKRFPAGIDAAMPGTDGALYVFQGGSYAGSAEPDVPRVIREHWGRVRNQFVDTGRVDAALFHGNAVFLFSGDQYVRYSGPDYQYVDEGYPRRVHGNWNQLEQIGIIPDLLPDPVSAAARGTAGEVYFFAGTRCAAPDGTLTEIKDRWGRVRNNIESLDRVDAALTDATGKLFLFSSDQLYRYTSPDQEYADEGYPRRLAGGWSQSTGGALPEAFHGGISAALRTSDNRTFCFGGDRYARVDIAAATSPINQHWGLVRNWIAANSRVDAAFRDPQGNTYLFRSDQFVRYTGTQYDFVDEGYPKAIGTRWGALPASFRSGIDAALTFVVNGVQRLYLFKGRDYVRYSTSDYTQLDPGYPKEIEDGDNVEGSWFRGFEVHDPYDGDGDGDIDVDAIYVDTYKNQPRICLFYRRGGTTQWKREYRYGDFGNQYRWTNGQRVDTLGEYAPFTHVDASFVAQDGTLHVFSDDRCATRPPAGGALTTPVFTRDRWARVRNQIAQLGRVDATLGMADGRTYLFCDQQFIRYSGPLRPGDADFYADEGYPKTIATQFGLEGVPISPAAAFQPGGFALCRDASGKIHSFAGTQYTYSGNPGTPAQVKARWGRVDNRIQQLSRIDAAYRAENDKLYLFCGDQYTRYSGALTPGSPEFYSDEGYPRRMATSWAGEGLGIDMPASFAALGSAILRDAQQTYVFAGESFTSSQSPAPRLVVDHWAKVRNQIQVENRIDAGFVLGQGSGAVTLLFCGDQYVRYSGAYDGFADEGYPKRIARLADVEGVFQLPALFLDSVRAVFAGRDGHLHAFSRAPGAGEPQSYVCSSNPGGVLSPRQKWGIVDNKLFDQSFVRAALHAPDGKLYLFSADQYLRYSDSHQELVDEGYPRKVLPSWTDEIQTSVLPPILGGGVDAALVIGGAHYYFADDQVVEPGAPVASRPLVERWGRVDNRLQATSRIDAGCVAPDGKLYLFTGDQVAIYSGSGRDYVDEEYPKVIAGSVGQAWPAAFQRDLDAVAAFEGRTYLFEGESHIRISDLRLRTPDPDYPRPITDKLVDRRDFELGALPDYWGFKDLSEAYSSPPCTLLQYLEGSDHGVDRLAAMTRWSAPEIARLAAAGALPGDGPADSRTLSALARHFAFADRLGATPSSLEAQISDKIFGAGPRDLAAAADLALSLIKAKTGPAEASATESALRDPINAATRDALVSYLLHALGLKDADDLYEYLLNDVRMGESATTSPIVEAIASIQLYYHRALMNLEEVPDGLTSQLQRWWTWMKNYRTWEANRRVFLYPENYIRPELRTVKSPAFAELEQNLLQDDITQASVQKAYTAYLEKFGEVSRLRIAGGYIYRDDRGESYVAVFGFARTEPPTYYFRRGRLPDQPTEAIAWEPWKKIDIAINSERVQPVYAFNRIFLFWIEQQSTNETAFSAGGTYGGAGSAQTAAPIFKYSFYNINGEWIAPQTIRADLRKDEVAGKRDRSWAIDDIAQARLYITNPSVKSEYDPEAYIYILLAIPSFSDPLVGRLTAALDFQPRAAISAAEASALTSSIDMTATFPARLGLAPDAPARWGAHFRGTVTSPWFSFDASGGSFLCRPAEPSPISLDDLRPWIELRGRTFTDVVTGFGTSDGDLFVFMTENGRKGFYRHGAPAGQPGPRSWQAPIFVDSVLPNGESAWPWARPPGFFEKYPAERIHEVFVSAGTTYGVTGSGYFTYSSSNYNFIDQDSELAAGRPAIDLLVEGAAPVGDWTSLLGGPHTLVRAFEYDDKLVLVTRRTDGVLEYGTADLDELRTHASAVPGAPTGLFGGWTHIDASFVLQQGPNQYLALTHGADVVALRWQDQTWAATDLGSYGVNEPRLTTAFTGTDGKLYFVCDDRYAEISNSATPAVFHPVDEKWGKYPPLFPDAAVIGPDGKLYLFCQGYCARYSSFDQVSALVMDDAAPPRIPEIWGTTFDKVTSAIRLGSKVVLLGEAGGEVRYERYSALPPGSVFQRDPGFPRRMQGAWGNLPTSFNLGFEAAIGVAGGGGSADELHLIREGQMVSYGGDSAHEIFELGEIRYSIIRLTSNTAARFSQILLGLGVPGLLSLATQKTQELPRFSTTPGERGQHVVSCTSTAYLGSYPDAPTNPPHGPVLDFESANGFYYWEIFFHIPYLIAQALNQAQRFEEARTWYEYVFDPTEKRSSPADRPFWKFLPFHDATDGSGQSYLEDPDQLLKYRNDPFDPHGLAQLRPIAYRKSFVMSYIDNLLDWGDLLFQQYTRESIGEATMLYVLAADLLGKRPEEIGKRKLALATMTYDELREAVLLDDELLVLENTHLEVPGDGGPALDATPNDSILSPYFFIPENQQFIDYWDRVSDRLHKIRSGLNIEGVRQSLSLFAPPVDPLALVKAFAGGAGAAQALSDYNAPVPHYRFGFMLARARELTGRVVQLGGALLSALEKQDAEELNLLRNTQERGILEMTLEIKQQQLEGARQSALGLQASLRSAQTRQAHYGRLLGEGLSVFEIFQLLAMHFAHGFTMGSSMMSVYASAASYIPNIGSPFAMTYGGLQIGPALTAISQFMRMQGEQFSYLGSLASLIGGWHRRAQDWELQRALATHDVEQFGRQIAASEIQVEVARQEIQVQRRQIRNNLSVETFMKSKFTSQQLYRWMVGKLSAVYFQTYQLALDHAKAAQRALQFEMGWSEGEAQYIGSYYWDSLEKGLLAGERLQLDLDRMEKAHLEKNKRRFEITRTTSLMLLDPLALVSLQQKGSCELELPEALFDGDFPGHYCRQIKTVSVSFPAVVGPYENFNATLTQLGHRTVMRPDINAVRYLLTGEGDVPDSIRVDWRPTQQVALSRGVNDSGLFQLNYQDERYLPFEGTGAVSRWRLQINGVDSAVHREHLRDVVLTVQYTALPGGDDFAEKVKSALPTTERAKLLDLAYDFPAQWQAFMLDPGGGLTFKLEKAHLPGATGAQVSGVYLHYDLTESGAGAIGRQALRLNGSVELPPDSLRGELSLPLGDWQLVPTGRAERFTAANIKSIALVVTYSAKPTF